MASGSSAASMLQLPHNLKPGVSNLDPYSSNVNGVGWDPLEVEDDAVFEPLHVYQPEAVEAAIKRIPLRPHTQHDNPGFYIGGSHAWYDKPLDDHDRLVVDEAEYGFANVVDVVVEHDPDSSAMLYEEKSDVLLDAASETFLFQLPPKFSGRAQLSSIVESDDDDTALEYIPPRELEALPLYAAAPSFEVDEESAPMGGGGEDNVDDRTTTVFEATTTEPSHVQEDETISAPSSVVSPTENTSFRPSSLEYICSPDYDDDHDDLPVHDTSHLALAAFAQLKRTDEVATDFDDTTYRQPPAYLDPGRDVPEPTQPANAETKVLPPIPPYSAAPSFDADAEEEEDENQRAAFLMATLSSVPSHIDFSDLSYGHPPAFLLEAGDEWVLPEPDLESAALSEPCEQQFQWKPKPQPTEVAQREPLPTALDELHGLTYSQPPLYDTADSEEDELEEVDCIKTLQYSSCPSYVEAESDAEPDEASYENIAIDEQLYEIETISDQVSYENDSSDDDIEVEEAVEVEEVEEVANPAIVEDYSSPPDFTDVSSDDDQIEVPQVDSVAKVYNAPPQFTESDDDIEAPVAVEVVAEPTLIEDYSQPPSFEDGSSDEDLVENPSEGIVVQQYNAPPTFIDSDGDTEEDNRPSDFVMKSDGETNAEPSEGERLNQQYNAPPLFDSETESENELDVDETVNEEKANFMKNYASAPRYEDDPDDYVPKNDDVKKTPAPSLFKFENDESEKDEYDQLGRLQLAKLLKRRDVDMSNCRTVPQLRTLARETDPEWDEYSSMGQVQLLAVLDNRKVTYSLCRSVAELRERARETAVVEDEYSKMSRLELVKVLKRRKADISNCATVASLRDLARETDPELDEYSGMGAAELKSILRLRTVSYGLCRTIEELRERARETDPKNAAHARNNSSKSNVEVEITPDSSPPVSPRSVGKLNISNFINQDQNQAPDQKSVGKLVVQSGKVETPSKERKKVGKLDAEEKFVRIRRSRGEKWGLKLAPSDGRVHVVSLSNVGAARSVLTELQVGTVVRSINGRDTSGMMKVDIAGIFTDSTLLELKLSIDEAPIETSTSRESGPARGTEETKAAGVQESVVNQIASSPSYESSAVRAESKPDVRVPDVEVDQVPAQKMPSHNADTLRNVEEVHTPALSEDNKVVSTSQLTSQSDESEAAESPKAEIVVPAKLNDQPTVPDDPEAPTENTTAESPKAESAVPAELNDQPNVLDDLGDLAFLLDSQSMDSPKECADHGQTLRIRRQPGQKWGLKLIPGDSAYKVAGVDVQGAAGSVKDALPEGTKVLSINGLATSDLGRNDLKAIVTDPLVLEITLGIQPPQSASSDPVSAEEPMYDNSDAAVSAPEVNVVHIVRDRGQKWGLKLARSDEGNRLKVVSVNPTGAAFAVMDKLPSETLVLSINGKDTALLSTADVKAIVTNPDLLDMALEVQLADLISSAHLNTPPQQEPTTEQPVSVTADEIPKAEGDRILVQRERGERWGLRITPFENRFRVAGVDVNGAAARVTTHIPSDVVVLSVNDVDTLNLTKEDLKNIVSNPDLLDLSLLVQRPDPNEDDEDHYAVAAIVPQPISMSERDSRGNSVHIHRDPGQKWGLKMTPQNGRYSVSGVSEIGAAASLGDVLPPGTVVMSINGRDTASLAMEDIKKLVTDRELLDLSLVVQRPATTSPQSETASSPSDVVRVSRVVGQAWGLKMLPHGQHFKMVGVDPAGAAHGLEEQLPRDTVVMAINGTETASLTRTEFMAMVRDPKLTILDLSVQRPDTTTLTDRA